MTDTSKMRAEFEVEFSKETASKATPEKLAVFEVYGSFEEMLRLGMVDDRRGETYATNIFASAWWAWQVSRQDLLREIDRLSARLCMCRDCQGRGEVYSGRSTYEGYNQPPEPIMDVCGTCGGEGVLGPFQDFEAIAAERDQLKIDLRNMREERDILQRHVDNFDRITSGIPALARMEALKVENEALRRDAERWKFFKDLSCQIQAFPHSWGHMTPEKMDFMCDEAMAKEQSHD